MWPCSVASLASSRTRPSKSSPASRGASAAVLFGGRHGGQAVRLQRLHVAQGALLGDLEVRGHVTERGMSPRFQKGEDRLAPGVHESDSTSFSTPRLKYSLRYSAWIGPYCWPHAGCGLSGLVSRGSGY